MGHIPQEAGLIGSADSHQLHWPFYFALLVVGQQMDELQTPDSMPHGVGSLAE